MPETVPHADPAPGRRAAQDGTRPYRGSAPSPAEAGSPPDPATPSKGDLAPSAQPAPSGVEGGQPAATARPRLYLIDGLRFVAAVGVMLYHYAALGYHHWGADAAEAFPELGPVVLYAILAPEMFFLVSGFVILMTAWGRDVPHVMASRISRLYPMYWVAVISTSILVVGIWPGNKDVDWGDAVVNLTMLQRLFDVPHVDGVYWTMWVELRFYLLIVLFVAWGITRRRILWFTFLWPLVAESVPLIAPGSLASTFLVSGSAPLLAGGMLFYLIFREGHRVVPWLLVAMNATLAVVHVVPDYATTVEENTGFATSDVAMGLVMVGCFAAIALIAFTPLSRVRWSWLVPLGALTYPLYLLHEWWGWWFIAHVHDTLGRWPTLVLTVALAVAAAWLVHRYFERRVGPPLRRWLETRLRMVRQRVAGAVGRGSTA